MISIVTKTSEGDVLFFDEEIEKFNWAVRNPEGTLFNVSMPTISASIVLNSSRVSIGGIGRGDLMLVLDALKVPKLSLHVEEVTVLPEKGRAEISCSGRPLGKLKLGEGVYSLNTPLITPDVLERPKTSKFELIEELGIEIDNNWSPAPEDMSYEGQIKLNSNREPREGHAVVASADDAVMAYLWGGDKLLNIAPSECIGGDRDSYYDYVTFEDGSEDVPEFSVGPEEIIDFDISPAQPVITGLRTAQKIKGGIETSFDLPVADVIRPFRIEGEDISAVYTRSYGTQTDLLAQSLLWADGNENTIASSQESVVGIFRDCYLAYQASLLAYIEIGTGVKWDYGGIVTVKEPGTDLQLTLPPGFLITDAQDTMMIYPENIPGIFSWGTRITLVDSRIVDSSTRTISFTADVRLDVYDPQDLYPYMRDDNIIVYFKVAAREGWDSVYIASWTSSSGVYFGSATVTRTVVLTTGEWADYVAEEPAITTHLHSWISRVERPERLLTASEDPLLGEVAYYAVYDSGLGGYVVTGQGSEVTRKGRTATAKLRTIDRVTSEVIAQKDFAEWSLYFLDMLSPLPRIVTTTPVGQSDQVLWFNDIHATELSDRINVGITQDLNYVYVMKDAFASSLSTESYKFVNAIIEDGVVYVTYATEWFSFLDSNVSYLKIVCPTPTTAYIERVVTVPLPISDQPPIHGMSLPMGGLDMMPAQTVIESGSVVDAFDDSFRGGTLVTLAFVAFRAEGISTSFIAIDSSGNVVSTTVLDGEWYFLDSGDMSTERAATAPIIQLSGSARTKPVTLYVLNNFTDRVVIQEISTRENTVWLQGSEEILFRRYRDMAVYALRGVKHTGGMIDRDYKPYWIFSHVPWAQREVGSELITTDLGSGVDNSIDLPFIVGGLQDLDIPVKEEGRMVVEIAAFNDAFNKYDIQMLDMPALMSYIAVTTRAGDAPRWMKIIGIDIEYSGIVKMRLSGIIVERSSGG